MLSSTPFITIFCALAVNFDHFLSRSISKRSATASSIRVKYWVCADRHGAIAPSLMLKFGSGTTRSISTSYFVPRPKQVSHAPYGELKEKFLGASSSKLVPHLGHAKCWLTVIGSPPSTSSISATPSASRSAVSSESVKRRLMLSLRTSRSTMMSIRCCSYFAKRLSFFRNSLISTTSPSTRARENPCAANSCSSVSYSPFLPRTTGANT